MRCAKRLTATSTRPSAAVVIAMDAPRAHAETGGDGRAEEKCGALYISLFPCNSSLGTFSTLRRIAQIVFDANKRRTLYSDGN